jgi:hypothetical protein
MKAAAADLCFAMSGMGRITLRDSAKFLDQLRVTLHRTEYQNRLSPKPSAVASETIREIALESDLQFA